MSIRSKRRRKAKRGGYLGMLERIARVLPVWPLATKEERFANAAGRSGRVYTHPEDADRIRARFASEGVAWEVTPSPWMQRGYLMAAEPVKPWPLMFQVSA